MSVQFEAVEVADDAPLSDRELLEEMIMALVDHPSLVKVEETKNGTRSSLIIHTDPSDRGKVIGKSGRTIEAMRILLNGVASRAGRHVSVNLVEDRRPFTPKLIETNHA